MHVVVEARRVLSGNEPEKQYLLTLLQQLTVTHHQHRFTLLADVELPVTASNCTLVVLPSRKSYFSLRYWYKTKLPALLRQQKADAFLSLNGCAVPSFLPQVVFISSPAAFTAASGPFAFLYRKLAKSSLRQGASIATPSSSLKEWVATQLNMSAERIMCIGYAVPAMYQPMHWQQQETLLESVTGGKAYFLYTGPFTEASLLLLLKAFSLFKKRQQSNLQLLVAGRFSLSKGLSEKLATYKYRADVQLRPELEADALAQMVAAAYAVITLSQQFTA
jgi:hypothetical protein